MIYHASATALIVFFIFVGSVLGISFFLGRRAKSAKGYFAAHGEIGWFVNGVAFAGDYLSAASFLGICGMIAFYGYDGFLYSIGYLAGWIVALFVIAEPIKRLGKYTFADALDSQFNSRGIKVAAAISTLIVSIFYLIPQMVGAGALCTPLLGLRHEYGVIIVGVVVLLIVVTAGMVSTTWVQFIKGSLLVLFCAILTVAILARGLHVQGSSPQDPTFKSELSLQDIQTAGASALPRTGAWNAKPYERFKLADGSIKTYRMNPAPSAEVLAAATGLLPDVKYDETQTLTVVTDPATHAESKLVNGLPLGEGEGKASLRPVGSVKSLPNGVQQTGSLGPIGYIDAIGQSTIITWGNEAIKEADGSTTTVYFQVPRKGADLLTAGSSPTFKGVRSLKLVDKLDFISLMLALFAGTASLPHILIRYYTVKDAAAARKSTVVGIASIGFFYVLTLFLGLGAMTSGQLDATNNNMSAPLLAKSFSELPFAMISAIAFTTVLGTVSGLILAASGAVAHDLMENVFKHHPNENAKVGAAKWSALVVGIIAIYLGIKFEKLNVTFLVGWAFNIAASANLPSLVMLLFWKRTTKQGITSAILVGLVSSLTWLLLTKEAFQFVYGYSAADALAKSVAPFSQPGLVTIPLGFVVLIVVSLLTPKRTPIPVQSEFQVAQ